MVDEDGALAHRVRRRRERQADLMDVGVAPDAGEDEFGVLRRIRRRRCRAAAIFADPSGAGPGVRL